MDKSGFLDNDIHPRGEKFSLERGQRKAAEIITTRLREICLIFRFKHALL